MGLWTFDLSCILIYWIVYNPSPFCAKLNNKTHTANEPCQLGPRLLSSNFTLPYLVSPMSRMKARLQQEKSTGTQKGHCSSFWRADIIAAPAEFKKKQLCHLPINTSTLLILHYWRTHQICIFVFKVLLSYTNINSLATRSLHNLSPYHRSSKMLVTLKLAKIVLSPN